MYNVIIDTFKGGVYMSTEDKREILQSITNLQESDKQFVLGVATGMVMSNNDDPSRPESNRKESAK